jgi:putative FmdB family regulatory protein
MPLYEYHCRDCGEEFEVLQPIGADGSHLECPECAAPRPEKQLSTFACSGDEPVSAGAGDCAGFT